MPRKTFLLDVDDTLYPKGSGPFSQVNSRIDSYVMSVCRVELAEAKSMRKSYIATYGSTMQGLMRHYGIDPGHYLKDVHDVPVEQILQKDERLRNTLSSMDGNLVAFTNGSYEYACRILNALGIESLISDLFSIEYMDFIPKPLAWPYRKAMALYGEDVENYLFVDDSIANVRTALDLGMSAVIVGGDDPQGRAASAPDIYGVFHYRKDCT